MKQIRILPKAYKRIDDYTDRYEDFFVKMYTDTGLWNEETILESYAQEAELRKQEIYTLHEQKLSPDTVIGHHIDRGLHISWRSKTIWVRWSDSGNIRTIEELEILSSQT